MPQQINKEKTAGQQQIGSPYIGLGLMDWLCF